jgi:molecular chaperone HscA
MLSSDDAEVIRGATEQTGRASELFAARRMDRSIQQALAGVSLDSLEQDVAE